MNTTNSHTHPKQIQFNNNPFTLAFTAMGQAFKINQNPAIVIIVAGIVLWIIDQVVSNVPDIASAFTENSDESIKTIVAASGFVFAIVFMLVSIFVNTVWNNFKTYVGTVNAKSQATTTSAALKAGLSKFWTALGINLFIGLIGSLFMLPGIFVLGIGLLLQAADLAAIAIGVYVLSGAVFIAGLVFAIRYSMARALSLYSVFDENTGVFQAMSRSVALTKGRLIEIWGMSFPGAIIPVVGSVLSVCGLGAHYLQLKVYRDHNVELPKTHILSWLPLMLLGCVLLLCLLVGGIILLAVAANAN